MTLRKLSMAAAIAGIVLAPAAGLAAQNHHGGARAHAQASRSHVSARTTTRHVTTRPSHRRHVTTRRVTTRTVHRPRTARRNVIVRRNVVVHRNVRVGHRYYGGIWFGPRRHFWRGRWYAYGVGPCWLVTPIGYVWVCG